MLLPMHSNGQYEVLYNKPNLSLEHLDTELILSLQ